MIVLELPNRPLVVVVSAESGVVVFAVVDEVLELLEDELLEDELLDDDPPEDELPPEPLLPEEPPLDCDPDDPLELLLELELFALVVLDVAAWKTTDRRSTSICRSSTRAICSRSISSFPAVEYFQ
ncbi:MAG TPA: hypothetical protein VL475_00270 [Planctomycetaceae bacterium]|nr:hypothetical protein [Planctomycetaceae bacterium]